MTLFKSLFFQPTLPQSIFTREKWTVEILRLLVLITSIPTIAVLFLTVFGIFDFSESYPLFINFLVLIAGWQAAKRGVWRWAGYIPPVCCFLLGAISIQKYGINHTTILLLSLSVLVSVLLQGVRTGAVFVLICTITYAWILHPSSQDFPVRFIASVVIVFFCLSGILLVLWYFLSQLNENVRYKLMVLNDLEDEVWRREKAEEVQRFQESHLKRLTDNMTDLIAEMDLEGRFLYTSPSYFPVLGYTQDQLFSMNAFDMVHPEDLERVQAEVAYMLKNDLPGQSKYRVRHNDGHYIWVDSSGKSMRDDKGKSTSFVISSHDITREKQAEENNRAIELKFQSIIEAVPLGMHLYTVNESSRLIFSGYNPAANTILGLDHAQFIGKEILEAFPGLEDTDIPETYLQIAQTGTMWMGEQVSYSNGAIVGAFDVHAFRIEPGKMAAVFQDITEKHKAEEALRLSEEKFSTAFQISPDSININRLSDGLYIDTNEGFSLLTGFTHEEVIGKTSVELDIWVNPADRARLVDGLMRDGIVNNLDAQFRKKNGQVLQGLMSAKLIEVNGEKCLLNITRDITERKMAELRLQDAHYELEQAYEATLQGWARALDMREHETADHSRRVIEYTVRMTSSLGIEEEKLVDVQRGALLHDLGKVGVPDNILLKPGPLSEDEWVIMRQHPVNAYNLLKDIEYLQSALDIPYCHHERWDGTGYPRGLRGEEIPLVARIFSIVDVWDALLSDRPYRPAWEKKAVVNYIREKSGMLFDPSIVDLFLRLVENDEI